MRIGFCFNTKRNGKDGLTTELDCDAPETIGELTKIMKDLGHEVTGVEADEDVFDKLKALKGKIDLVFNIAEGQYGDARESWVPIACEILKIPYTHSTPTVHALKLNKELAKLAVAGLGIKVPKKYPCEFPVIIKPNAEGSSVGVFNDNVVDSSQKLEARIQDLRKKGLKGELLIEQYIDGREFTVSLIGNRESLQVLPIIEQKFDMLEPGMKKIAGYELKWLVEDKLADLKKAYDCPANLKDEIRDMINETSKRIFNGLEVRDCARIDYRMDNKNNLYFIEINTLPGINPDENIISYFPAAARADGMSMTDVVNRIIEETIKRYELYKCFENVIY